MKSLVSNLPWSLGQLRARLFAGLLLLNLLVLGLGSYSLWRDRQLYDDRVAASTQNLAQLMARDMSATINRVDFALMLVVEQMQTRMRDGQLDSVWVNDFLKMHQSHVPEIIGLRITDDQGRVQFGQGMVAGDVDLSDRLHFQIHRDQTDAGVVVGKPVKARIDEIWAIPISRRLNKPDGSFAGIAYSNLPVDSLVKMFADMQLGAHGLVAFRNQNYELLARYPVASDSGGGLGTVAVSNEFLAMQSAGLRHGTFYSTSPVDRIQRVNSFAFLEGYPLYMIVGQSQDDYLQGWIRNVQETLGLVFLFFLTSVLLTAFLYRSAKQQLRLSEALREDEERWGFALGAGNFSVWDWDLKSGAVTMTQHGKAVFGFADGEIGDMMTEWSERSHPDDLPRVMEALKDHFRHRSPSVSVEFRIRCKSNDWKWVHARGMVVKRAPDGRPLRMVGTHVDISERRQREEERRLASAVFQMADEAMVITSAQNEILAVNPAFTSITGYEPEEVVGRNPKLLSAKTHSRAFYQEMWAQLIETGGWSGEVINRKKSGEVYVEWLSLKRVLDERGQLTHHVAVFSDITARKAAEGRIRHLALHDALTDLPNRSLLTERLEQAILRAKRERTHFGLLYFDLDKFKPVNDNHGHEVGDLLLKAVASRVVDCVRASDTVARLGGDEFVVLLGAVDTNEDALQVAEKILAALDQPFEVGGHTVDISTSIGLAIYPDHGEDATLLTRNADAAMYQAKKNGRNQVALYQPGM